MTAPTEPPASTGTLGLIEWRLSRIEEALRGVLSHDLWEAEHRALVQRVEDLEHAAERDQAARRALATGVIASVAGVLLTTASTLLQRIG